MYVLRARLFATYSGSPGPHSGLQTRNTRSPLGTPDASVPTRYCQTTVPTRHTRSPPRDVQKSCFKMLNPCDSEIGSPLYHLRTEGHTWGHIKGCAKGRGRFTSREQICTHSRRTRWRCVKRAIPRSSHVPVHVDGRPRVKHQGKQRTTLVLP